MCVCIYKYSYPLLLPELTGKFIMHWGLNIFSLLLSVIRVLGFVMFSPELCVSEWKKFFNFITSKISMLLKFKYWKENIEKHSLIRKWKQIVWCILYIYQYFICIYNVLYWRSCTFLKHFFFLYNWGIILFSYLLRGYHLIRFGIYFHWYY